MASKIDIRYWYNRTYISPVSRKKNLVNNFLDLIGENYTIGMTVDDLDNILATPTPSGMSTPQQRHALCKFSVDRKLVRKLNRIEANNLLQQCIHSAAIKNLGLEVKTTFSKQ